MLRKKTKFRRRPKSISLSQINFFVMKNEQLLETSENQELDDISPVLNEF